MGLDPARIESIVHDVLERLESGDRSPGRGAPLGVHGTLDEAVAAARRSFAAYRDVPLESDLTTPLAYYLANAQLDTLGYTGFLRPDSLGEKVGRAVMVATGAAVSQLTRKLTSR